ncbi:peptide chain release factor N(5)-glutamine methyltransferase [Geothermobacter hydrogeniphilus]|uniref:Release factor glutamine methyltransferase n=1 Tax=Geothermobacter hydrogeniphilus TaxID=1969733 RepID=A0A2K2HA19_9BACT|nr:peptide chain release factor N(5)-glutamine methyltransferase [Geothermobacter hydrogeniphilus]PNU20164.1 peptide chain release factor N(5)-glutamine methyltransferase [Geothermobacter hydrogeniphilus]
MTEPWTLLKVLQWTAAHLKSKGVENGRLDAELLLCDLLDLDRVGLYLNFDRPLQQSELAAYRERVRRRAQREPLQHIVGHAGFWTLDLQVGPEALVPRADTEILVEEALKRLPDSDAAVLDVGTGSGCIALALAGEKPMLRLTGLDRSGAALQLAARNAESTGLAERIEWLPGDLRDLPSGPWRMIVSNPPYIPRADLSALMPEVRDFEPVEALDGGPDGLDAYRALAGQTDCLADGGWLLVEIGIGQAEAVRGLFAAAGLDELFVRDDYAGIPRVVGGRKKHQHSA